jgi:small subunit ribosomal protein S20
MIGGAKSLANSRQAIKRIKVAEKKRLANTTRKSALRTSIKKSKLAIENNDPQAANLVQSTAKALDKAVAKNVIHKNTAARYKSNLAKASNIASK